MPEPISLGTAMIASSAISGGMGLAGASQAQGSSRNATQYALWAENYNRKKRRQILDPLTSAGTNALNQLMRDPGRIDYQGMIDGLEDDPFYQFQLQQGLDAVSGNAATAGMLDSGRALKELMGYGQGMASSQLDKAYGRALNEKTSRRNELMNIAGMGANALGAVAGGGSIAPQVAANTALNNASYDMQRAQIGSDMLGGLFQGGLFQASGLTLRDLYGLPSAGGGVNYTRPNVPGAAMAGF